MPRLLILVSVVVFVDAMLFGALAPLIPGYADRFEPPGDYHIAALTDLDTTTWRTPGFLDQVVPGALRLSLAEGETKTQDLRIGQ